MKPVHRLSLFFAALITLAVVSACHFWQKPTTSPSTSSPIATHSEAPRKPSANNSNIGSIDYQKLPPEARDVIARIKMHGTFEFKQDGKTFQNREGILPQQPRGYYQEYTVITPAAKNRGARRIVAGKGTTGDVATAGEFYYTADHYRSFYRVKE